MYKDEEIEKFLENLDIVQVIGEYVTLKKTGANYKGFSPFKEERTPSFVVSPTKNIFSAEMEERRVGKECRSRWSPYH